MSGERIQVVHEGSGRKVLCSGVFNGIHPEHVKLLHFASQFGPVTVGLNGDDYNSMKNGARAIPVHDRILLLESIRWVTDVIVFHEPNPSDLILKIRPRYYNKGPDYKRLPLIEEAACKICGTEILFRPGNYTYSSSALFMPTKDPV